MLFWFFRIAECVAIVDPELLGAVRVLAGIWTTLCVTAVTSRETKACPAHCVGRPIDSSHRRPWYSVAPARSKNIKLSMLVSIINTSLSESKLGKDLLNSTL